MFTFSVNGGITSYHIVGCCPKSVSFAVVLVMVGLKLSNSDKLLQPEQGVRKNVDGATLFKRVHYVYKNNINLR